MPTESRVVVKCDAPHCDQVLEGADGTTLFGSLEDALATAEVQDWLVTHSRRDGTDAAGTYCRLHWHWTFGVRTPYWGPRPRRYRR